MKEEENYTKDLVFKKIVINILQGKWGQGRVGRGMVKYIWEERGRSQRVPGDIGTEGGIGRDEV